MASFVTITGKTKTTHSGLRDCKDSEPKDFELKSPVIINDDGEKADVNFVACAKRCSGDGCQAAKDEGMKVCPGFKIDNY